MESDEGTFQPSGLGFTGSAKAREIVEEIMTLLQPINVTDVYDNADGTDISYWMRDGVPGEWHRSSHAVAGAIDGVVFWKQ